MKLRVGRERGAGRRAFFTVSAVRLALTAAALLAVTASAAALAVVVERRDAPPAPLAAPSASGDGDPAPPDLAAIPAGDGPATVPAFGLTSWRSNAPSPGDLALTRTSGAPYWRFDLMTSVTDDRTWAPIRTYDLLVAGAARQGVELLPILMRSRPEPGLGLKRYAEPPETDREWDRWRARVRLYAERYGPDGAFWSENPEVPYRPLRAWEVWNEPNLSEFWDRREVDAAEYARLLVETRAVLRSVDPQARIVIGGLTSRHDATSYLSALLDEVRACHADAIGIHPYAPTAEGAIDHLEAVRTAADAAGAEELPLWITEIGWRVGSTSYAGVPDARVQAAYYDRFLADVGRRREELLLGPTFAFSLRDRVDPQTGRVDNRTGLLTAGARPAWRVWQRAARSAPPLDLPKARRCRQ